MTIELLVARGDVAEFLESSKQSLDQIAPFVQRSVEVAALDAILFRRDDRLDYSCFYSWSGRPVTSMTLAHLATSLL